MDNIPTTPISSRPENRRNSRLWTNQPALSLPSLTTSNVVPETYLSSPSGRTVPHLEEYTRPRAHNPMGVTFRTGRDRDRRLTDLSDASLPGRDYTADQAEVPTRSNLASAPKPPTPPSTLSVPGPSVLAPVPDIVPIPIQAPKPTTRALVPYNWVFSSITYIHLPTLFLAHHS